MITKVVQITFGSALLIFTTVKYAVGGELPPGNVDCDGGLTPSTLLEVGAQCDGRHVMVRGFLRVGPEMRGLWDSEEDIKQANYRNACVTVYNPRGFKINGPVRLADVYGTFYAQRPPRLVILWACTDAIIEIDRVVDIHKN